MMKLVIATTNPGKVREINGILSQPANRTRLARPVSGHRRAGRDRRNVRRQRAAEGALLRTSHGPPERRRRLGLEIGALGNAPGVHSARWHGTDYAVKFRKIYELLQERGASGSPARFVCHIALADEGRILFEATGIIDGEIAPEPRGTNGFGYDPIFYYPPFDCTLAELDLERKATVSHRGKAFGLLRQAILNAEC